MASSSPNAPHRKIKQVICLGGSYSGNHAAELLAKTLPSDYRVLLIDRQTHFNHLYLFPRVGVVPGHAEKVFVPYAKMLASAANPPPATLPPLSLSDPTPTTKSQLKSIYVNAGVTRIGDGWVEVDKDLGEDVLGPEPSEEDVDEVEVLDRKLEELDVTAQGSRRRRIPFEFLVYALGCSLPPPLLTPARTKQDGVAFLKAQTDRIAKASSILIAGGGALGIQYATDIADLYNNPTHAHLRPTDCVAPKKVTLVHSRDRFLPLYKQEVHDEVMRRLEVLGVKVVLGGRLALPSREDEAEVDGTTRSVETKSGEKIEYDLLMRCTGQKPNSGLLAGYLPEAIDEYGFVNVKKTTQVDVPATTPAKKAQNVYVIGDVANAGVIKAGHTGWNQAEIAVQNIMAQVMCGRSMEAPAPSSLSAPSSEDTSSSSSEGAITPPTMIDYKPSPPQIKVTLGLNHSVSELLPSMDATETNVETKSDGPVEGYWQFLWTSRGLSTDDVSI